jgi:Domain of unknown function (DUF4249)
MKKNSYFILLLSIFVTAISCEKEITIDLPNNNKKVVVEGNIEIGKPPLIQLTRTGNVFETIDLTNFDKFLITDATVYVNNIQLDKICSSALPDSLLQEVSEITGIPVDLLASIDYCIYTSANPLLIGETETIYELKFEYEGNTIRANTYIPTPIKLDSVWFEYYANEDSLGYIRAQLTDPTALGNAYRWFAKRINKYPNGEVKDPYFIAPFGSSFEDEFFNGTTFELGYLRGLQPNSSKPDDLNEERFLFKIGDTVVVKYCAITPETYKFFRTFENQIGNTGSPFASPTNIASNIEGGLGIWAGYGAAYDTVIVKAY